MDTNKFGQVPFHTSDDLNVSIKLDLYYRVLNEAKT